MSKASFLFRQLYFAMAMFGSVVGVAGGAWVGISLLVVSHHSIRALAGIPRTAWIIPEIPTWLDDKERAMANVTVAVPTMLGLAAGLVGARAIWRRLALRRFGWTREEIEAFEKRDPGW
jgi:hypothetical protein